MPDLLDSPDSGRGDRPLEMQTERHGDKETRRAEEITAPFSPGLPVSLSPCLEPVLLCQRVSKWYGPVIGVNQVTLELRSGITGLVGSNGAGKSTLMRLITGHLRPDLGSIQVLGRDSWSTAARRHVGYCPETDAFYEEMSGRQFVESMARLCGYPRREAEERTEAALERVGMAGRAERCVRGYSKGMRQRIKLAQALLHDPELLVLDEPLSGIDPVGRSEFVRLFRDLAALGKCLLISSHELEELEKLTDHIAIMAHGRIAAVGTVAQIRDRLDNHPLLIRIDVKKSAPGDNGRDSVEQRRLATGLLKLRDVVGVELLDSSPEESVDPVLVRARNPQRFFQELTRLILEEWYEIARLETLDDSTQAVLGYLLRGRSA
ncbi:MAG TPA: ABC transporter ATP-binding protein [Gemmataceae bacterium]|nr:ABC transporter ATP-binding protein [Gemmataceae bacterium]